VAAVAHKARLFWREIRVVLNGAEVRAADSANVDQLATEVVGGQFLAEAEAVVVAKFLLAILNVVLEAEHLPILATNV
jgi:hypothetical protein